MKLLILISVIFISSLSMASPNNQQNSMKGKITPKMWKVIMQKPWSVVWIKKSAELSDLHSSTFCDVVDEPRHTRDEVDAVRHFMFSSLLASKLGPKFTRDFLTAHEQRTDTYNDENIMDLKNNDLGIHFSNKLKRFSKSSTKLKKIKLELRSRIKNGDLYVLNTERSKCANSEKFPNM